MSGTPLSSVGVQVYIYEVEVVPTSVQVDNTVRGVLVPVPGPHVAKRLLHPIDQSGLDLGHPLASSPKFGSSIIPSQVATVRSLQCNAVETTSFILKFRPQEECGLRT